MFNHEFASLSMVHTYCLQPKIVFKMFKVFITVSFQTWRFLLNVSCFISLSRESIVANLDQQVSGNVDISNHTFVIVAASVYYLEQNYESALRILNEADHLEW